MIQGINQYKILIHSQERDLEEEGCLASLPKKNRFGHSASSLVDGVDSLKGTGGGLLMKVMLQEA